MSKNIIFKVLTALMFVAVAVLWLLSALEIITLPLAWVIAIFCAGIGLVFILKGIFQKNLSVIRKFNIFAGAAFFVAAVLALVGTIIQDNLILPIIAIVLTVAILVSVLVVGGKKWDHGDNQNAGYKTYRQRKEEEEKDNK